MEQNLSIQQLLDKTIENHGSDLHIVAGFKPIIRINGALRQVDMNPDLSKELSEKLIFELLTEEQKEILLANRSLDFSYGFGNGNYGDKGRFRVNIYFQRGTVAASLRLLPATVKTIEELGLPNICHTFSSFKQGFVLVTGPTGHGKTTTIASMVNEINMSRSENIITIEDPIEYVYSKGKSVISQREIGQDAHSWNEALKSILREDPNVVVIGEMRDPESVASAITIAETGHLVFSTLHTNSASQSIDRIIDSFPENQQNQVRTQLASALAGIVSQRLIPSINGMRVVASEVLIATNAIRSNIREAKTHLIDSIIETSTDVGMNTMESSLAFLVKKGVITLETARGYVLRQDLFDRLIG